MKLLALMLVWVMSAVSVALAAPLQDPKDVHILRYENNKLDQNAYKFGFDLSDGTKRAEEGQLVSVGTNKELLRVTGRYSWVGPDGVEIIVNYVANESGFQPRIQRGPASAVPSRVLKVDDLSDRDFVGLGPMLLASIVG